MHFCKMMGVFCVLKGRMGMVLSYEGREWCRYATTKVKGTVAYLPNGVVVLDRRVSEMATNQGYISTDTMVGC